MKEMFYICYYKSFIEDPVTPVTTAVECLITGVMIAAGVFLNYSFLEKMKEDRRNTPLGRKGNVVEPIMRWFCWLQIVFWPCNLLYQWINCNEIIPTEDTPLWLGYVLWNVMTLGRSYIAYNSLFVSLIRYVYIVHQRKSNQWNFRKVGNRFLFANIVLPFMLWLIALFIHDPVWIQSRDEYRICVNFYTGSNTTTNENLPRSAPVELASRYLPEKLVYILDIITMLISALVFLNIAEAFFYHQIFKTIKRYFYPSTDNWKLLGFCYYYSLP